MKPHKDLYEVEDFLSESTFQLYCAGKDPRCTEYWENYLQQHPGQAETIREAKRLYIILSGNKKPLNASEDMLRQRVQRPRILSLFSRKAWIGAAAAVLIAGTLSIMLYRGQTPDRNPAYSTEKQYTTKAGERKKITLADGSVILLNAKSSLTLDKNFNTSSRRVCLVGEAYFDVAHNKEKPFKVSTTDFDINVLGTSFNVKAYPGESSETVLIRGLIRMEGKGSKRSSITLRPSQKVTFYHQAATPVGNKTVKPAAQQPEIAIKQYTRLHDSSIAEMAWTQNRLEIVDQGFAEVKSLLERWYNVEIVLKDKELEKYRFTATFQKENIEQVLNALQQAEHFTYEIKGRKITISK